MTVGRLFFVWPTEQGLVGRFWVVFFLNADGRGLVGRLGVLLRAGIVLLCLRSREDALTKVLVFLGWLER